MIQIHEHGYWLEKNEKSHWFDPLLAPALLEFFKGYTVSDIGCGRGDYVKLLKDSGIDIKGYDGNPFSKEWNPETEIIDLSQKINIPITDWVLSLEVGEHIPPEFEDTFISNLKRHNRVGIVISWAVPGQGGTGHFNEQSNEYIASKFGEYERDLEAEKMLREKADFTWFKKTIMVFRK